MHISSVRCLPANRPKAASTGLSVCSTTVLPGSLKRILPVVDFLVRTSRPPNDQNTRCGYVYDNEKNNSAEGRLTIYILSDRNAFAPKHAMS